eukprot:gene7031-7776_t
MSPSWRQLFSFSQCGSKSRPEHSTKNIWFCELPDDLCREILTVWLAEADAIVKLDTALCNHRYRKDFLRQLQTPDFSDIFYSLNPKLVGGKFEGYLQWIQIRAVRITSLVVSLRTLTSKRGKELFRSMNLVAIRKMHLCAPAQEDNKAIAVYKWRKLLSSCDGLEELEVSTRCQGGELLPEALKHCPLRSLRLHYQLLSALTPSSLACWHRSLLRLHLLHCELTDDLMGQLLLQCQGLVELQVVQCSMVTIKSLPVIFGNLPLLEQLAFVLPRTLRVDGDVGALPIAPSLKILDLPVRGLPVDFPQRLLAACPRLEQVHTLRFSVAYEHGMRSIAILDPQIMFPEQMITILRRFGSELQAVEATDLSAEQVCQLLQGCRAPLCSLKLVRCALNDDSLKMLCQHGPDLQVLHLFACGGLQDRHLLMLTEYCKNVVDCRIPGSALISDDALISLKRWPSLQRLDICRCEQVSDKGVQAVLEHCVFLRHLSAAHSRLSPSMLSALQIRFRAHY